MVLCVLVLDLDLELELEKVSLNENVGGFCICSFNGQRFVLIRFRLSNMI